ncbi:MAG TPA: tetratricopeptide repeat protein [Bacillota bacterium]|jgi:tetratricopeptide (TPR) repeat protein
MALFSKPKKSEYPNVNENLERGNALLGQGKLAEATQEFAEAVKINPDSAWAHSYLGIAHAARKKPDKALAEFQKALQLSPNEAQLHYNLATFYYEQRRLRKAADKYTRAVRLNPKSADAHYGLGIICLAQFEGILHDQGGWMDSPDLDRFVAKEWSRDPRKVDTAVKEFRTALEVDSSGFTEGAPRVRAEIETSVGAEATEVCARA